MDRPIAVHYHNVPTSYSIPNSASQNEATVVIVPKKEAQLPHDIATGVKEVGSLPGMHLSKQPGVNKESLLKKLQEQTDKTIKLTIPVPSNPSEGLKFPLEITLSLKEPAPGCRLCKKDEAIKVTIRSSDGRETETNAIGGYWVETEDKLHCIITHKEQRIMDYELNKENDENSSDDSYQVKSSMLQVTKYIVPGVTHLEAATHDNGLYETHNAVLDGLPIPTALIENDFTQWNSNPQARLMLLRSIGGIISHASKNPSFDLRSMVHVLAAVVFGAGGFLLGDEISAAIQTNAGFPAKSFLGEDFSDPMVKKSLTTGLFLSLTSFFGFITTKNAMGVNSQFVSDPTEKRAIAVRMTALDILGGQIITGLIIAGAMLVGEHIKATAPFNGTTPFNGTVPIIGTVPNGKIGTILLNSLFAQTIGGGIASAVQSYLISEKNWSPLKALLPFIGLRVAAYRGLAIAVQSLTTHLWDETGLTKEKVFSMMISNIINEAVIQALNGISFVSGRFKASDGSEEQLMAYQKEIQDLLREEFSSDNPSEQQLKDYAKITGIQVNKLNTFRLNVSALFDTGPKTAWGKISSYFVTRNPDSIAAKAVTTPFISALMGQSDDEYKQLITIKKALRERTTASMSSKGTVKYKEL